MFRKYFEAISAIIAILATILVAFDSFKSESSLDMLRKESSSLSIQLKSLELQAELDKQIKSILAETKDQGTLDQLSLNAKFDNLEQKIEQITDQTLGLRQAINPTKPEEILSIARLTDEIVNLKSDFISLEKSVNNQQKVFQDSILRELKSSNESSTLILVVLIPLVINFLYTVWKDFRATGKQNE